MDWFHCNQCFRKDGDHFFVTSCGHIFCKKCVTLEKCAVCGTACKHLALSDNLKPQEKIYFKSPVETAMQYFSHISQVWRFQKKQTDLLIAFYKHRITKLEAAMQEAQQMVTSQEKELSVLKKENGELKKCLAILKESPNWYQGSRLATPRPVGITSPSQSVTPRPSSRHSSQVVRNPFTSFYSQPILQAFTCLFWTGDFFFQTIPKWWGFRPHKSPHPQQFRSEGKQNPTRESSWFPATSSADSLRTETDGTSQVKRSMDYFQMKVLQGLIYTYCIKEGLEHPIPIKSDGLGKCFPALFPGFTLYPYLS
ncbi:RING finger protein 212B isoform X2 [Ursus americanus]|uniref:RING finger protein 212B isoform X2 n=1 Tax=Ursus americanus TaxID=9643 RepID=UPI001E67D13B|nr:RING finger protein 212B isoform X2 [Ursus americanus]